MGIHTGSVEKETGSNAILGGPIQWLTTGLEAAAVDDILAVTTQEKDDGPTTYKAEDGDFTAQPLHPRPVRVDWSATTGTVNAVIFRLYGLNFWRDAAPPETIRLTAEGDQDSRTSFRHLGAVTVEIEGAPGATVDVSVGFGLGFGTPVPFRDPSTTIGDLADDANNRDIIAVRDPTDDTAIAVDTLHPHPYNTVVIDAAPADVKVEMQTTFGILAGR